MKFAYQIDGGQTVEKSSQKSMIHVDIPINSTGRKKVSVLNKNDGVIYSRLIVNGQPIVGDQTEASNHLAIKVVYKTTGGKTIKTI